MIKNLSKAPFPYFGGKTDAASVVWDALGDVAHYAEPFCGSLAVLLKRPHPCNRTYFGETVNDADGLLVNAWRSIQKFPEETAKYCSWPVTEADLMARHLWLLKWKSDVMLERVMGDVEFCDPKAAGYWLYGICAWIGGGWCDGSGPWVVGDDGRIVQDKSESGVSRKLPHLSDDGRGVHAPQMREPGVSRQLPHLSDDGRGVHAPQMREPGVGDYHDMTMPELLRWFRFLSARLRHVRIINGDWSRLCTSGALKMLTVRMGEGIAGVFLDPPYGTTANRDDRLYATDSLTVADDVREWCLKNGGDPKYRIVLAGFDGEHNTLEEHGWRAVEWFKKGFLKGGMKQLSKTEHHQQHRERLWMSPHCLVVNTETDQQETLQLAGTES